MKNRDKGSSRRSKVVQLALIGTPLFFSGCYGVADTVVVERRVADRVEVIEVARPNYHYSPYYGGYVPIVVPIGGYVGPSYYSGGYRAPRTVVNNYVTTHKTTVVKPPTPTPAPVRTTTSTTTTAPKPATASPSTTTVNTKSTTTSSTTIKSGGFGSTGRSSTSSSGSSSAGS